MGSMRLRSSRIDGIVALYSITISREIAWPFCVFRDFFSKVPGGRPCRTISRKFLVPAPNRRFREKFAKVPGVRCTSLRKVSGV